MQLQSYCQRIAGYYIAVTFQRAYESDNIRRRAILGEIVFYKL